MTKTKSVWKKGIHVIHVSAPAMSNIG